MCKELEEELERGDNAAQALAEHVAEMGANNVEITKEVNGRSYKIHVDKLPHPEDFKEQNG